MMTQDEVTALVAEGIISADQGQKIQAFQRRPDSPAAGSAPLPTAPAIPFSGILYYLGGFLIVFAISYYLGNNWEQLGDAGRISMSLLLMVVFGATGKYLLRTPYRVAGELLLLAGTVAVPLLLYSVERALGVWPPATEFAGDLTYQNYLGRINTAWIVLDLLTVVIAYIIFSSFKSPILTLPVAHFFWFLVLDGISFLTDSRGWDHVELRSWLSLAAGALLVGWGIYYRLRRDSRVGDWPWVYGLAIMLGSLLTLRFSAEEPMKLTYQLLILGFSIAALYAASPLRSKTFLTFGSLAMLEFVQDISWTYFRDSLGFSAMLLVSGALTIYVGILIQKYYKKHYVGN